MGQSAKWCYAKPETLALSPSEIKVYIEGSKLIKKAQGMGPLNVGPDIEGLIGVYAITPSGEKDAIVTTEQSKFSPQEFMVPKGFKLEK
jgi:hypothetical protein